MKKVFVSFVFHGNMNYDRYPKSLIWREFPRIYQAVVDRFFLYPGLKAHFQLSGVTILSLLEASPQILDQLKALKSRGQISFTGTYYSEPVSMCMDGETNLRCAWLGTQVVERFLGRPEGFFPQEQSYHPQMPWVLSRLGLQWITVMRGESTKLKPFRLQGLSGTTAVGVPVVRFEEEMEALYENADDGDLIVLVGDLEMPPDLDLFVETVAAMRSHGKGISYTTITEYLDEFGTFGTQFCSPSSWTDPVENPTFSRWVSDPMDIMIHEAGRKAMAAFQHAALLDCSLMISSGIHGDRAAEEMKNTPHYDPAAWDIENPRDFPRVEPDFLKRSDKVTSLSRAEHYLLWAVNSDSRGWTPLVERRRERINSFDNSRYISEEVIDANLSIIAESLGRGIGGSNGRRFLIYNPGPARTTHIKLQGLQPAKLINHRGEALRTLCYRQKGSTTIESEIELPGYGYTVVQTGAEDEIQRVAFSPGRSVRNGNMELTVDDEGRLTIARQGQELRLALAPLCFLETSRGTVIRRSPMAEGKLTAEVGQHFHPQLRMHRQLDFTLHVQATFTLTETEVICDFLFDFTKPVLIGACSATPANIEPDWDPRGLVIDVKGDSGTVFYDVPYGMLAHGNMGESFITAQRCAILQGRRRGFALASKSGAQSFHCRPNKGILGICLGSSTIGGPAEPVFCSIAEKKLEVRHFERWEREAFFGQYHHSFVIRAFDGEWASHQIPCWVRSQTDAVYIREIDTGGAAEEENCTKSLIALEPCGIAINAAESSSDGHYEIRLNELNGRPGPFHLSIGSHDIGGNIGAFEIKTLTLDDQGFHTV